MNFIKLSLYLLGFTLAIVSCKKDDEPSIAPIEIRDRAEQQIADMISLDAYLDTHYYNKEELDALGTNVSLSDIDIITLAEGESIPVGYTLLRTAVGNPKETTFANVGYEYYVLKLNQGGGSESPKFCDKIRFNYEGFTLDNIVFDFSINPLDSDLIGNNTTSFGLITGWSKVIPDFNTAESFSENGDGTVSYLNKGVGIMFLPSGLAYFSSGSTGIPSYSPIIFKFELLQTSENDHDGDGVPSYLEDLNGNGRFDMNFTDLTDPNDDDTDGDGIPDYLDFDDDGDGISTINEDINNDGNPRNDDSNGNNIPNYLDITDKIRKSL